MCMSALDSGPPENMLGKDSLPRGKCLCIQELHRISKAIHGYLDP